VHFKAREVRPHIADYFGNNERTDDNHFWEITWKVMGFKAIFKS
jgi:hypothetical protein